MRYLQDRATKQPSEYEAFYKEYGLFLKEGIVTAQDHSEREEIAKLLRYESSKSPDTKISLSEYCSRVGLDQKNIYYLCAPSRVLAESSPYYEALKKKDVEVLFCYEPHDEIVLMQLGMFGGKNVTSAEKEMRQDTANVADLGEGSLRKSEIDELVPWIKEKLSGKVSEVKITDRLDSHPCVITVEEMGAARHFIRTQSHQMPEANRYALLQPQFEINPKFVEIEFLLLLMIKNIIFFCRHSIIKKLHKIRTSDPELGELLTKQLFVNAMVAAGLAEDPRTLLNNMNELLSKALEKH